MIWVHKLDRLITIFLLEKTSKFKKFQKTVQTKNQLKILEIKPCQAFLQVFPVFLLILYLIATRFFRFPLEKHIWSLIKYSILCNFHDLLYSLTFVVFQKFNLQNNYFFSSQQENFWLKLNLPPPEDIIERETYPTCLSDIFLLCFQYH